MDTNNWKNEFQSPSVEFRGKPFWSWNGKLNLEELLKQVKAFSQMGYGGFHIHSRVGLADEYMGPHFLNCVKAVHEYAKKLGMETWLYDEDKWPSGFGAGYATNSEDTIAKCLMISRRLINDGEKVTGRKQPSRLTENGIATLIAAYNVRLDEKGFLLYYKRVEKNSKDANIYAYKIVTDKSSWFNNASYGDLLNPKTAQKIIEVTHEKYSNILGKEFGNTVPAIFSDEPQHCMSHTFKFAAGDEEPSIPYTDDMDNSFKDIYGYSILDKLPEVFWNTSELISKPRWQLHDWLTEQFRCNYFSVIQHWCKNNGLMFDGHVMREETLLSQTQCVGETMRLYDAYDLPGIDILADKHEYSTAKQVQSVVRQNGKKGVVCEMFGVTNWDFSFRKQKHQADWLMALGTTVRVPHLAWMQMGGESKRDYPAALDLHSPWYKRYKVMEDYFARVCSFIQNGKPVVKTVVIHPIESFWSLYGPDDQTIEIRNRFEEQFRTCIEWLLFGQIDFDFAAESLLCEQSINYVEGKLKIGEMLYEAVVVPPLFTIRKNTLDILIKFAEVGGKIIFMGEIPQYVDAQKTCSFDIKNSVNIGFDQYALLDSLELQRDVKIGPAKNILANNIVYQLRENRDEKWLFAAIGKSADQTEKLSFFTEDNVTPTIMVGIRGKYAIEVCNAFTGEITPCATEYEENYTWTRLPFYADDSILLHMTKCEKVFFPDIPQKRYGKEEYIDTIKAFELEEKNVLVLDQAMFSVDNGLFYGFDEILRLDNIIRERLNFQKRTDAFLQPWITGEKNITEHTVQLKYEIYSEIETGEVSLALEPECQIEWNGNSISSDIRGEYIDTSIYSVKLPKIEKGLNTLILKIPYGEKTNLEACYLLGEFSVKVIGDKAIITKMPERIGFGSITEQGFPFYGGNISYHIEICIKHDGKYVLTVPKFSGAMLDVKVDGKLKSPIICDPNRTSLGILNEGKHNIEIICYGNRINTMGQLHNCSMETVYYGPNSWRSNGKNWSYSYQIKPFGILASCFIQEEETL